MRSPNHLILNFPTTLSKETNWLANFLLNKNSSFSIFFITTSNLNRRPNLLFKKKNKYSLLLLKKFYTFFLYKKLYFYFLKTDTKPQKLNSNRIFSIINIHFIKKERLYTKLKYSRSPAYDIVSGGSAALLAGFIGFLISEKYGFEMVDSGDFYYLFMYIVFLSFSLRPLLISFNSNFTLKQFLSPKLFFNFYLIFIYFFLYKFKY